MESRFVFVVSMNDIQFYELSALILKRGGKSLRAENTIVLFQEKPQAEYSAVSPDQANVILKDSGSRGRNGIFLLFEGISFLTD